MKRHLMILVNYQTLNKIINKVTQLNIMIFDIQIPCKIELETSEDDDDVEQTGLGEEEKVELDMRELEREEEEYIEEEMAEDKQEDDDSSHRQSSVVTTLSKISEVKLMFENQKLLG